VANSRAIVLASAGLAVPLKVVNSLFTLASCRIAIKPPGHHGVICFGRARQKLDNKIRRFGRGYLDGRQLPGNPVPPARLRFESRPDGGEGPRLVSAATVAMNCDLVDLPRSAPRADYAKPPPRKRRSGRADALIRKNREIDTNQGGPRLLWQIIHKCAFDSARRSDCLHAIPHTDFQAAAKTSRHVLIPRCEACDAFGLNSDGVGR
jgi:hypothetical protein